MTRSGLGLTRAAIEARLAEEEGGGGEAEAEAEAEATLHVATKPPGAESTSGPRTFLLLVLPGTFPAIDSSKEVAS